MISATTDHRALALEKIQQLAPILVDEGLDCWLLLARETGTGFVCDPSVELLLPGSVIGLSVYGFVPDGRHFAVVSVYDVAQTESFGLFDEVLAYDEAPDSAIQAALAARQPRTIGVNFSEADHGADGITYGQLLALRRAMGATYAARILSGERVAERLRGVKSVSELDAMRRAIAATHELFEAFEQQLVPGATEESLHCWMHAALRRRHWTSAWDARWCPGITIGPTSPVGHTQPTATALQPGQTVAIDFGVRLDGYTADLQRTWYLPAAHETEVPSALQRAFDAVRGTIQRGFEQLRPGVPGYQIDGVARDYFLSYGYPEFRHNLGHMVGRMAHDGGGVLAPRWPAFGDRAERLVEPGQVFTLELGVMTEYGLVSVEEMALVTEQGAEMLSVPEQTELIVVGR